MYEYGMVFFWMKKSLFVAVEGIDRSGKSSLVEMLRKSLDERGFSVYVVRYPNRNNETGRLISEVLQGRKSVPKETMHLMFSANRWEDKDALEKMVQEDNSVILCDRYILSGVSYSVANDLPVKFAVSSDKGLIQPGLTLFLDVSPDVVEKRDGFGSEIYENKPFQEKVYAAMKELVEEYNHKKIPSVEKGTTHSTALSYILQYFEK